MAYANAFAVTMTFIWLVCTFGVALLPELSLTMNGWFMHGLNMRVMGMWNVTFDGFILGGVVLIAFAWISGYIFGASLEYFSRK